MGSLAPERLLALRRVATIESVASSTRIEGSKLSNAQVDALLANLKIRAFTTRDEQEVAGYAQVMELLFASWGHITSNENRIQQLHLDLLRHSSKDAHHRGRYKTICNNVGAFNAQGEPAKRIDDAVSNGLTLLEGKAVSASDRVADLISESSAQPNPRLWLMVDAENRLSGVLSPFELM